MSMYLRKAIESDQPTIRRMVRQEGLNPLDVRWQNFIVAVDESDAIIGIGQIRLHPTCKELGSLIVRSEYRGQGIGAALIAALEQIAGYPLYLDCAGHNKPYYERFGYREVTGAEIPPGMLPPPAIMRVARWLGVKVHVMRKDAPR